jgi:hypothetical protein
MECIEKNGSKIKFLLPFFLLKNSENWNDECSSQSSSLHRVATINIVHNSSFITHHSVQVPIDQIHWQPHDIRIRAFDAANFA